MIRPEDWWMVGLKRKPAAHMVPTGGSAQPFREMGELFPDWAAHPRRRLTLGLTCSLHWGSARQLLAAFHVAHPDVDLMAEDLSEADLAREFAARRIDVAIAPNGAARRGWKATPLWRERLIAALPEGGPLAQENAVSPAGLRGETILLAGEVSAQPAFQHAIIAALGGHPAAFMHCRVERDTLFDLVAVGAGVTVCPGATTGAFYPGVRFRPITSDAAEIGYSLIWTQGDPGEALADFIAFAQRMACQETCHERP
jgi:DNA-binding transcriptional LysR family regulator